jgi:anti-sigma B factor antagonist
MCVVVVEGELDLLTAPLLEHHVREQLFAAPAHLILDLESVQFLGSSGLSCLLRARELAQTRGAQLHLAGLITSAVARAVKITGLLGVFSTYPTLIHAVIELVGQAEAARSDPVAPVPVLTAFWRCLMGCVWILELCEFDAGTGLGAVVDWINSGVPANQPAPDMARELLAVHGLWLLPDPVTGSSTGSRHRIGYVCADAELIMLADQLRGDAAQAGIHPVMLAAWVAAGYSLNTAVGWIRAGCPFPR